MCINVLTKSLNAAFFTSVYDKAFSNIFMKLWNKNMKYDFPQRRLWVMEEIQLSHLSHLRVRVCVFARLLWNISKDCCISTGFNRWGHGWRDDIPKRSSRSHAWSRSVCSWVCVCVCGCMFVWMSPLQMAALWRRLDWPVFPMTDTDRTSQFPEGTSN